MAWTSTFAGPLSGVVHVAFTDRADGDLSASVDPSVLADRRHSVAPHPWTWLSQRHGAGVVFVDEPGAGRGRAGDALVTPCSGTVLCIQVADCAPVLAFSAHTDGILVAAAHAGWRGLREGVLDAMTAAMRSAGATGIDWLIGPCVSPASYEFSAGDLEGMVELFGSGVVGTTDMGTPALDLRAAVCSAMAANDCGGPLGPTQPCTVASAAHWSHRGSCDPQRQAGVIWWESRGG